MGYYNNYTGSISYKTIDNEQVNLINDFIENHNKLDSLITMRNDGIVKRNQFAGNVQIKNQRLEININDRKNYLFSEFLQELVNYIQSIGAPVLNVYIERTGETYGDFETYTISGNTISSNRSETAKEIFGK